MTAFKLPRLKANLSIVNGKGQPLDYFLRLFNIELAQRIEQQEIDQDAILAELQVVQQELADQLALIIEAQNTADEAKSIAEAAATGAAADIVTIAADVVSTTFSNIAVINFPNRLANGLWDFLISLSGYGTGISSGDVEIRVIESGQPTALASDTVSVPNGPPAAALTVSFAPGPYDQTAPAGDVIILVQARRTIAGDTTRLDGSFFVTYTPRPA